MPELKGPRGEPGYRGEDGDTGATGETVSNTFDLIDKFYLTTQFKHF